MSKSPKGMHDMDGWHRINCHAREMVYRQAVSLSPASTLTDPHGNYGNPVIFTEWWWTGAAEEYPVLRDYRYQTGDGEPACRHYISTGPDSWKGDDA